MADESERRRDLLLQIVEVSDALGRLKTAADAAAVGDEARRWVERFLLVRKRVESILAAQQVLCVNSLGMAYNPELHRVVDVAPSPEKPGTILEVFAEAYVLSAGDRMSVLRPGEVRIAGDGPRRENG